MRNFRIPEGLILIAVYIVVTLLFQTIAFSVSWVVTQFSGPAGLLVFVGTFLAALYLGWPVAVRIFDRTGWEHAGKSLLFAGAFFVGCSGQEAFAEAYDLEFGHRPVYASR